MLLFNEACPLDKSSDAPPGKPEIQFSKFFRPQRVDIAHFRRIEIWKCLEGAFYRPRNIKHLAKRPLRRFAHSQVPGALSKYFPWRLARDGA
jgi:hypothetical protein